MGRLWWYDTGRGWGKVSLELGEPEECWKASRGAASLDYCFSHIVKFTCQGDINMSAFFMSGGSSSERSCRSNCLAPSLSGPFPTASILKARTRENSFTQGPVLEGFSVDGMLSPNHECLLLLGLVEHNLFYLTRNNSVDNAQSYNFCSSHVIYLKAESAE